MLEGCQWGSSFWISKRFDTDQLTLFHTATKDHISALKKLLTVNGTRFLLGTPLHLSTRSAKDDDTTFEWVEDVEDPIPKYVRRDDTQYERFAYDGASAPGGPAYTGRLSFEGVAKVGKMRVWPANVPDADSVVAIQNVVDMIRARAPCPADKYSKRTAQEVCDVCFHTETVSMAVAPHIATVPRFSRMVINTDPLQAMLPEHVATSLEIPRVSCMGM